MKKKHNGSTFIELWSWEYDYKSKSELWHIEPIVGYTLYTIQSR